MAKVIAPNKQYTGLSASVMFVNGVGETDNEHLLQWFIQRGYEVEWPEPEVEVEVELPVDPPEDPPINEASTAEVIAPKDALPELTEEDAVAALKAIAEETPKSGRKGK